MRTADATCCCWLARSLAFLTLAVMTLAAGTGCRSNKLSIIQARNAFAGGDLVTAQATLRELADGPRRGRHESELDLAIVEFAQGDTEAAERRLRALRDHFDATPQHSLDDAASLVTDDNARTFQLAGYEQVTLRSLLALCSLVSDGNDAEAYCLQAQAKHEELRREAEAKSDPSRAFQAVAFEPYLRGTLREATHQDYDAAERAFRLVSSMRPDFVPAGVDIQRAGSGTHSQSGNGVLYVIGFVGQGPQLVETDAPTTSASLQIAASLIKRAKQDGEEDEDEPVLPTIASVKIPQVYVPPNAIEALGVSVDGTLLGATQSLTDFAELARQRNEAEMPWIIGRAVARRVLKETSVEATANTLGLSGNAAAAFKFAAINAWSATEKADTRCWGLLPRDLQVLRTELPAGQHSIALQALAPDGQPILSPHGVSVTIEDGRSHYVIAIAPDDIVSVLP